MEVIPLRYTRISDNNNGAENPDIHDIEKNDLEIINEKAEI